MHGFCVKTVFVDENYTEQCLFDDVIHNSNGVVLLRGTNTYLDKLKNALAYSDELSIYDNGHHVVAVVNICPVEYNSLLDGIGVNAEVRNFAMTKVFDIWSDSVKKDINFDSDSKEFKAFLNKIGYYDTDYVICKVNEN